MAPTARSTPTTSTQSYGLRYSGVRHAPGAKGEKVPGTVDHSEHVGSGDLLFGGIRLIAGIQSHGSEHGAVYAQQREPHLLQAGSAYLQALLLDHWAQANSASVCHDRRDEREAVAESKQIRYLRNQLAEKAHREARPSTAEPTTAG